MSSGRKPGLNKTKNALPPRRQQRGVEQREPGPVPEDFEDLQLQLLGIFDGKSVVQPQENCTASAQMDVGQKNGTNMEPW